MTTRPIHDIREMIVSFEKLRIFSDYRTPCTMRSLVKIAINLVTGTAPSRWAVTNLKPRRAVPAQVFLRLKAVAPS